MLDLIVGGNYKWSPAKIIFFPLKIGIQHEISIAYAHSSIITTSKFKSGQYLSNTLSIAPVFVQQTTYEF